MHELQVESNGSPHATTRSSRALNDEIRPFTDAKSHKNKVVLYGDMNLFTDREAGNTLNPSELDWIIGLALRFREDMEISVYREQDQPLDKPGLVQKYWAVQLRYSFDVPKRFWKK